LKHIMSESNLIKIECINKSNCFGKMFRSFQTSNTHIFPHISVCVYY